MRRRWISVVAIVAAATLVLVVGGLATVLLVFKPDDSDSARLGCRKEAAKRLHVDEAALMNILYRDSTRALGGARYQVRFHVDGRDAQGVDVRIRYLCVAKVTDLGWGRARIKVESLSPETRSPRAVSPPLPRSSADGGVFDNLEAKRLCKQAAVSQFGVSEEAVSNVFYNDASTALGSDRYRIRFHIDRQSVQGDTVRTGYGCLVTFAPSVNRGRGEVESIDPE